MKSADTLNYSFSLYNVNNNTFFRASTEMLFPTDAHEIFSFCDESRCFALGAQPDVELLAVEKDFDPFKDGGSGIGLRGKLTAMHEIPL